MFSGILAAEYVAKDILRRSLGFRLERGRDIQSYALVHLVGVGGNIVMAPVCLQEPGEVEAVPEAALAVRAQYAVVIVEVWMRDLAGLSEDEIAEARRVYEQDNVSELQQMEGVEHHLVAVLEHPEGFRVWHLPIIEGSEPVGMPDDSTLHGLPANITQLGPGGILASAIARVKLANVTTVAEA